MVPLITGIGIDIVEISRIENSLERYEGRFINRLLSASEQKLAEGLRGRMLSQFVAGRFAAKEAVFKALGTGLGDAKWVDVQVLRDDKGKPFVRLAGVALSRAESQSISKIHVSISHCREYAAAQAVLEDGPDILGVGK